MERTLATAAATLLGLLVGHAAWANPCPPGNPPTNCAPAPGAILDLAGQTIPKAYQQYSTNFVATNAATSITFSLRDDSAFLGLDDVEVTTGGGSNLLTNGGFEAGPVGSQTPSGWTYLDPYGAGANTAVSNGPNPPFPGPHTGTNYFRDGAVQAYDDLSQTIATTPGQTYAISFWLNEDSTLSTFSATSTNGNASSGGNGVDVLVYTGLASVVPVPEPATLTMFGASLAGLLLVRRRKAP